MKKFACAAVVVLATSASAGAQSLAVGPVAAHLGVGGGVPIQINRTFTISLNGNKTKFDAAQRMGGLDCELDMNFMGGGATLDVHPFQNGFLISAGYYFNNNLVELTSTPGAKTRIGGKSYSTGEIGQIQGALTMPSFTPFVGIGYDTTFHGVGALSFSVRAGAFLVGDSSVALNATGTLSNDPSFLSDLRAEAESIENEFNNAGLLPVVSVGVRYRF